jgi:N-acetylmuramoyl-L-alanine amidase
MIVLVLLAVTACAPLPVRSPHAEPRFDLPLKNSRLAGWSFVLDPGHGGPERGAAAKIPDASAEAELNLAVALFLGGILEACGATVTTTRTADLPAADTFLPLAAELRYRALLATDRDADFFISIHHNASIGPKRNRVEVYHKLFSQGPARELAAAILERFSLLYPDHDTSLRLGNFAVLRHSPSEAVLVECTYLSDKDLSRRLETVRLLRLEAEAIAAGILSYAERGHPRIKVEEESSAIRIKARDRIPLSRLEVTTEDGVRLAEWKTDGDSIERRLPRPETAPLVILAANVAGRTSRLVFDPSAPSASGDTRKTVVLLSPVAPPAALPSSSHVRLEWVLTPRGIEESIRAIERRRPAYAIVHLPGPENRVTHYFRSATGRDLARALARKLGGLVVREEVHDLLTHTSMPCVIIRSEQDAATLAAAISEALAAE